MSIWDHIKKTGEPLVEPLEAEESIDSEVEHAQSGDTVKGKIFSLNSKGYGFIISPAIPFERIFFHWTSLVRETLRFPKLEEGMKIEFVAVENEPNDWRAAKVRVLDNTTNNNANTKE